MTLTITEFVGTSYVWFSLMTFSPKRVKFQIDQSEHYSTKEFAEVLKILTRQASPEVWRKCGLERAISSAGHGSESTDLLPDKLNLVPAISFSCDRRTGAREGLAERVGFEPTLRFPCIDAATTVNRSTGFLIQPTAANDRR